MSQVRQAPWEAWADETTIKSVIKAIHQRPIAYYPIHADIMGNVSGGIVLSQILYWYSAVGEERFFKTDAEIRKETHVSEWELKEAKRKFKTLPFLTITVEGLPAKTFYEVDAVALAMHISHLSEGQNPPTGSENVSQPVGRPSPNQLGGPLQTINTSEITAETTTDILPLFLTKSKKRIRGEELTMFEQFWNTFNYKQGKAEAGDAWLGIVWKPDRQAQFEQILQGAREEAQKRPSLLQAGKTPKMAQGWISGRRWEDTPPSSLPPTCPQCVEKDPSARFSHWLSFRDEDALKQHFYLAFGFDTGQKKFIDNVAWWRTKQSIREIQDNAGRENPRDLL